MNPLRDYCNRSGDTELGLGWKEENEHGFLVWRVQDNKFVIVNMYGDGLYWEDWIDNKAETLGIENILGATKRSPKAWIRKYGYETTGYILERKASWVV